MKGSITYKALIACIGILHIWCSYGHMLFSESNTLWGLFANWGNQQVLYDGEMLERYWIIYDINHTFRWLLLIGTAVWVLAASIPARYKANLLILLTAFGIEASFDLFQFVVLQGNNKWAGVELAIMGLTFIAFLMSVEIIAVPDKIREKVKGLNVDVLLVVNTPLKHLTSSKITSVQTLLQYLETAEEKRLLAEAEKLILESKEQNQSLSTAERYVRQQRSLRTLRRMFNMYEQYQDAGAKACFTEVINLLLQANENEIARLTTKLNHEN